MTERVTSKAVVRSDALDYGNALKAQISMALHANTPVICLACTKSNPMGVECTDEGDMHGKVSSTWQWESGPDTPLVEICGKFDSVEAVHKDK